jgi:RNA recognition motif-containing protein
MVLGLVSNGNLKFPLFTFQSRHSLTIEIACKLFVGGLSWDTTVDGLIILMKPPKFDWRDFERVSIHTFFSGLKYFFSQYGEIADAIVMLDRMTGLSRGIRFLLFSSVGKLTEFYLFIRFRVCDVYESRVMS